MDSEQHINWHTLQKRIRDVRNLWDKETEYRRRVVKGDRQQWTVPVVKCEIDPGPIVEYEE